MGMTNATLGDLIDNGDSVRVYCETWGCHNGSGVDLQALAARLGRSHGALHQDLVGLPWKCRKCGGRRVSFRLTPGCKQYTFHRDTGPDKPFLDDDP